MAVTNSKYGCVAQTIGLAAWLFVLSPGIQAGSAICRKSPSSENRTALTKQGWREALRKVKPGMTIAACDAAVKQALKGEFFEVESASRGAKGRNFPLRYYTLDDNWRLVVHHDYLREKIVRFWITGLEDLKNDVHEPVFPLVQAIHRVPRIRGQNFDPVPLIRSVNTLHAAGFESSLLALREYDKLYFQFFDKHEWFLHDLDHQRIFLIGHLLFMRKDGKKQFPIPALGFEAPMFRFLHGPEYPQKLEFGDPAWPHFPLFLSGDVPFLLVQGFSGTGLPTPPNDLLDFVEKNCRLRDKPLAPNDAPWKSLDKLLSMPAAARETELQRDGTSMLRLQVLRALRPAADAKRQELIHSYLMPTHLGGRALSDEQWEELCRWFADHKVSWDHRYMSYQSRRDTRDESSPP